MPTISKENYLKEIYTSTNLSGELVSTSMLAEKLEITNAATSEMAKKLAEQGLIQYEKYKGLELTEEGKKVALNIIRKHRLWELFLIKVLKLNWSEVHHEAELLEHQTSDNLIDKIDEFLGYPKFDPHGAPIPDKYGVLPKTPAAIPLAEAKKGKSYIVSKVNDQITGLVEYFTKIELLLGTVFIVLDKLEFDESVLIKFNNKEISLSKLVSENLFVTGNKGL